ncbi:non-heme chloroperoxidase [Halenospora varia]|nr:non-heme chloroperoxidase [Halenospora varia]
MPYITTPDSTRIFYKDWGNPSGPIITFSHGWPLNSDNFESQMFFLASQGYRCIAHDRRGHGRSDQPWEGNNMDTYADDLHHLFETLDLKDVMMVGHSTGGGEVIRFCARHGTGRVRKAVLISAVPPIMVKTDQNPTGTPIEVFDSFRAAMLSDRSQFFLDVPTGPFFGFNRPNAKTSQGLIQRAYDCIKAFSETDFTDDMKNLEIPVLLLHGDDDQVVPIGASAEAGVKLLKKGVLKVYPGGPHALPNIFADEVNKDLLEFVRE